MFLSFIAMLGLRGMDYLEEMNQGEKPEPSAMERQRDEDRETEMRSLRTRQAYLK